MKTDELKHILAMNGFYWYRVMICLMLKAVNQTGMNREKTHKVFESIQRMKLIPVKLMRKNRELKKRQLLRTRRPVRLVWENTRSGHLTLWQNFQRILI
jgi:hypothetical protein